MKEQDRFTLSSLEESGDDDQQVRELLTSAGPREAVPAEDFASIKEAAQAEWLAVANEAQQRQRARRITLPLAASLVVAMLAAWWVLARPQLSEDITLASIDRFVGSVSWGNENTGPLNPVTGAETLDFGSVVETANGTNPGRIALALPGGSSVRLDAGSRLRLTGLNTMELERGALYLDSHPTGGPSNTYTISTPLGLVRNLGTQFEIRIDTGLSVRVREGRVSVETTGETLEAGAGDTLALDQTGTVSRGRIQAFDDSWSWVTDIVPSIEIDGLTLDRFLSRVSRESGFSVVFEDDAIAQQARTVRLGGTVEGLTPSEALTVVMPSTGLDYVLDDGVLRIQRLP